MIAVIDASLTMAWHFEDEATPATKDLLDRIARDGALAPPLWRFEVANAFQAAIRRRRIDAAYRDAELADLARLPIILDADGEAYVWTTTLRLAERYALTIYDACYLELALRRHLPLATLDKDLRIAAAAAGIALLGL